MLSNTCTKLNRQSLWFQSHDNVFFYLLHANAFLKPRFFHLVIINLSTKFVSVNSNPARCSIRVYFFSSTEFFFIGFQCMWSFDCCHLKLLAIGVYAIAPWCSMSTLYKAIHFIVNWIEESYANSNKQQPMNVFFFWCLFFFLVFFFSYFLCNFICVRIVRGILVAIAVQTT